MSILDIVRGAVRPYIGIAFATAIVVVGGILVLRFADAEMAKMFAVFILATGATVTGFYFGERSQKPK